MENHGIFQFSSEFEDCCIFDDNQPRQRHFIDKNYTPIEWEHGYFLKSIENLTMPKHYFLSNDTFVHGDNKHLDVFHPKFALHLKGLLFPPNFHFR